MFETELTVVGNVATKPSRRLLSPSGAALTQFLLISRSRRYDKHQGDWVDGDRLALNVSCWREMSDHVVRSVKKGEPVIAYGRLTSYQSTDPVTGAKRTRYNLDARAVGHNLAHGFAVFEPAGRASAADALTGEAATWPGLDGPIDGAWGYQGRERPEFDRILQTAAQQEAPHGSTPGRLPDQARDETEEQREEAAMA